MNKLEWRANSKLWREYYLYSHTKYFIGDYKLANEYLTLAEDTYKACWETNNSKGWDWLNGVGLSV